MRTRTVSGLGLAAPTLLAALALLAAGCGSSGSTSSGAGAGSSSGGAGAAPGSSGSAPGAPGALAAEAKSAATGDIPDKQVYLVFRNAQAGYSIKYPEGWTQKGTGSDATISDKNNIVHIVIGTGGDPTTGSMSAELSRLKSSNPTLTFRPPAAIRLRVGQAIKSTYTTRSAPNPVTGKRVVLVVDRYEFAHGNRRVTADLGTPEGVDNVDAYRKMINSFAWR